MLRCVPTLLIICGIALVTTVQYILDTSGDTTIDWLIILGKKFHGNLLSLIG